MAEFLSPDSKGSASLTLGEVVVQTRNNFPDERYRPRVFLDTNQYHIYGIDPKPYQIFTTVDGTGSKPELAERLVELSRPTLGGNPTDYSPFKSLAYDVIAMSESDEVRHGKFPLGVYNIIDVNQATPGMINALAEGLSEVCNKGRFALLNGETAELGYRTSGYGDSRMNWNAGTISLVVPNKLILGKELAPNQPVVAIREKSIRSNGLTKARDILEAAYLHRLGVPSKADYVLEELADHFYPDEVPDKIMYNPGDPLETLPFLDRLLGHNFLEQVQLPWHDEFGDIARELLQPSTLYSPLMYALQNGIDGKRQVDIVAAAHISGGGVPEKAKRMLDSKGLGIHVDNVFPDPLGVSMLLELAETLPEETANHLIDSRRASEQWNRGIGFMIVTKTYGDAGRAIEIATQNGYEAAIAGNILDQPVIEYGDHSWTYSPKAT